MTSNDNAPGSKPAHYTSGRAPEGDRAGGDQIEPGRQPDEIVPGEGDHAQPGSTPDEVAPNQGDFDMPDSAPAEIPDQPDTGPVESPPPD